MRVDLNLHPVLYWRARPRAFSRSRGRCSIATTAAAACEIAQLVRSTRAMTYVFIGWQDEGHDREQFERALELERALVGWTSSIRRMNQKFSWKASSHERISR